MKDVLPAIQPSTVPSVGSKAFLGVRTSIWQVVAVVAGAGIGALIEGRVYSGSTTFGAVIGLLLGSAGFLTNPRTKVRVS